MGSRKYSLVVTAIFAAIVVEVACYARLPSDLPGLIAAMETNDMGVRAAAAVRIDELFGHQGLLLALRDGGPQARAQAARRLSRFNDDEVVQRLMQTARTESDRQVRYAAIAALGLIGDPQASVILDGLRNDKDPLVREAVQEAQRRIAAAKAK